MDYTDAALQPITVGDCSRLRLGPRRDLIRHHHQFDDILAPPEFLRGEDPNGRATRMPYASQQGKQYPGTHSFPRRYFRQPDGSTRVEWAPYWAYRVQVQRLESPGDRWHRWHASRGLSWLSYPTRIARSRSRTGRVSRFPAHDRLDHSGIRQAPGAVRRGGRGARAVARVKLLALQDVPEESFEPPVTSLGEYLDTPIPIPPSLVWPTIVVRGEITATLGRAGKGKTTMNLNRILRWGCGRPLYDSFRDKEGKPYLAPTDPIKSLIIENEGLGGHVPSQDGRDAEQLRRPAHRRGPRADPRERHGLGRRRLLRPQAGQRRRLGQG